ncbi:MAG: copper resistance protein CopC [Gemmatimonadota bacterium]
MSPLRTALLLASILGLLALPAGAAAHEELRGAMPASGDTLAAAPDQLRLTFVNPVQLGLAHLTLIGPRGTVDLGELRRASGVAEVLVAPVRGRLVAGTYTVRWQVAGPDGHPVRGEYTFTIRPDAAGLAPAPSQGEVTAPEERAATGAGNVAVPLSEFDSESPLYVVVRWLTFVGLLGVIGVVAFRVFVVPLVDRSGSLSNRAALLAKASSRAARIGLGAVVVLVVALVLRLCAQLYALHGPVQTFDTAGVGWLLAGTTWGLGWLLQAGGIVVVAFGLALTGSRGRAGWTLAAVGASILGFTPALSGHAAGVQGVGWLAIVADGFHVLGAGGWMGGLLVVVTAGIPVALRQPTRPEAATAALINAFSPTALVFAGVVVATGVFSAWLHLGEVSALWSTGYGRTLLLKLGVASLVFGTGAYNWLKVRPTLGREAAAGRLRRSAVVELVVALAVLAVTAVLVATPLPAAP